MIDFRYHVVSIVAVFLALTVGIVLGSSFVKEPVVRELRSQANGLRAANANLHTEVRDLQRDSQYRDAFAKQVASTLVRDRLVGQQVVTVTLPGADEKLTQSLNKVLTDSAGAKVTGQVAVKDSFTDDKRQENLGSLTAQLRPADLDLGDASVQQAASAEIARAVVTAQPALVAQPSSAGDTVLSGLKEGGFLDLKGTPSRRASLVLVVAGPPAHDAGATKRNNAAYLTLISALDKAGLGAVVAGSADAAGDGSVIAALRDSGKAAKETSSVDVADTDPGRIAVVLALLAETQHKSGHYGVHGTTDGPLPPVL